jgi:uncharacterized damage-inducible protein DinB
MLHKQDLGRLLAYTVWANHRTLGAAASLSNEDFTRDLRSSFGGVRGTLAHIMGAEWIWLERFKGMSPTKLLDEAEFPDLTALRERWARIEQDRASWFERLPDSAAGAMLSYTSTEGKPFQAPLWQLVQHVVNHSTYHRGQVATLMRQLDGKPMGTDMVAWDREGPRGERPV